MDKKEQTRLRVQRYKAKNSVTESPNNVTQSPDSVTMDAENVTHDVTQYHPLLYALVDPDKRKKLEKIYHSLKEHNQDKNVYYGYEGISFDIVGEMLEVTS